MNLSQEMLDEIEGKMNAVSAEPSKEGQEVQAAEPSGQSNYSKDELKAMEDGWRPLEEWDGDPEDWVDARTFNRNGEFMDRIKSQSSQIKGLEKKLENAMKTLDELSEHHKKVSQREYEKALNDLKSLKKEALSMGDYDQVVDLDEKLIELSAAKDEQDAYEARKKEANPNQLPQEILDWVEENPWVEQDPILGAAAEVFMKEILAEEPDLQGNLKAVLRKVETKVKKEFPNKFQSERKARPTAIEPTSRANVNTQRATKYTGRHLNDQQRIIGRRFVETGAVKNLDAYAEQLAEIGELDIQKGK